MVDLPIYRGELTNAALADCNNTHTILLELIGKYRSVLEVGCATGYLTRILSEHNRCRVTGFEINPIAAETARPYLQNLIIGNLENPADVRRVQNRFDVIVMADVIEHLALPEVPLRTLHDSLAPGGQLLVSIPNVAHWTIRRMLLLGKWELADRGIMDRTHLRWYTHKTAYQLIEACGYRIIKHRASYIFPAHWRANWGHRFAVWAQRRSMPRFFDDLFAVQHIFVAVPI